MTPWGRFVGDLCGYLGRNEKELFETTDSAELSRWYARWNRIGFSDWRQAGMLGATIATTALRGKFDQHSFMEIIPPEEKEQTQEIEEQKNLASTIHAALGIT